MNDARQESPSAGGAPQPNSERQRRRGHEVRSAAQGLIGYINILSDEAQSHLTPQEAMLMERIWHYGKKLSELSMELLTEVEELTKQLSSPPSE